MAEVSPTIGRESVDTPDVRALIIAHLADMGALSPEGSMHALDVDALRHPAIVVLGARIDGVLAGVGALLQVDATRAELKSMRVDDRFRGRGVGRALLLRLLDDARAAGTESVWLETGTAPEFVAAQRLYTSEGFALCDPFGAYVVDPHSVFMTKTL